MKTRHTNADMLETLPMYFEGGGRLRCSTTVLGLVGALAAACSAPSSRADLATNVPTQGQPTDAGSASDANFFDDAGATNVAADAGAVDAVTVDAPPKAGDAGPDAAADGAPAHLDGSAEGGEGLADASPDADAGSEDAATCYAPGQPPSSSIFMPCPFASTGVQSEQYFAYNTFVDAGVWRATCAIDPPWMVCTTGTPEDGIPSVEYACCAPAPACVPIWGFWELEAACQPTNAGNTCSTSNGCGGMEGCPENECPQ